MKRKTIEIICLLIFGITLIGCSGKSKLAKSDEIRKPKINKVNFSDNEISIANKKCFDYEKTGNSFKILNLDGEAVISGEIESLGKGTGKFKSIINFLTVNKKFTNPKVIGRNDIIFKLLDYHAINENCEIDNDKLMEFITQENKL
ncbi:MAG: hypothetical protein AB8H03_27445 [Saprospiraceae bacterium]